MLIAESKTVSKNIDNIHVVVLAETSDRRIAFHRLWDSHDNFSALKWITLVSYFRDRSRRQPWSSGIQLERSLQLSISRVLYIAKSSKRNDQCYLSNLWLVLIVFPFSSKWLWKIPRMTKKNVGKFSQKQC